MGSRDHAGLPSAGMLLGAPQENESQRGGANGPSVGSGLTAQFPLWPSGALAHSLAHSRLCPPTVCPGHPPQSTRVQSVRTEHLPMKLCACSSSERQSGCGCTNTVDREPALRVVSLQLASQNSSHTAVTEVVPGVGGPFYFLQPEARSFLIQESQVCGYGVPRSWCSRWQEAHGRRPPGPQTRVRTEQMNK